MSNLVAKCGINCKTCPWGPYPRKNMMPEEFEQYKKSAKKILGYMPIKTPCMTCKTPNEKIPKEIKLPRKKCLIRQCVDKSGMENCAFCSSFPCDTLLETADLWNKESIEKKLGTAISEKEYHIFVKPFEGFKRLKSIRASLKPDELVEPAKVTKSKIKMVSFSKKLPFKKNIKTVKAIHNLLISLNTSSFGLQDFNTFAQHYKLEKIKAHIFRFLWILGKYSDIEKKKDSYMIVDSETYINNRESEKTLAIRSYIENIVFKNLTNNGIHSELVALNGVKNEDLTTGTGYLRKKGWLLKVSFEDKIGGLALIEEFQSYIKKLDKKHGKRAFQHFRNADMRILIEP